MLHNFCLNDFVSAPQHNINKKNIFWKFGENATWWRYSTLRDIIFLYIPILSSHFFKIADINKNDVYICRKYTLGSNFGVIITFLLSFNVFLWVVGMGVGRCFILPRWTNVPGNARDKIEVMSNFLFSTVNMEI